MQDWLRLTFGPIRPKTTFMKIGRPLEYDPDTVLDKAMIIFWEKGYDATSMHDLLQGVNISKSSLYQAYKNKHNLLLVKMTVSYVGRSQADPLTNAFYNDAEERFEMLLNIFKVFGHTPKLGKVFTESVMEMLQDANRIPIKMRFYSLNIT